MRSNLFALLASTLPVVAMAQSAPVSSSATPPAVESVPLEAPGPGSAGLLSPSVTGLPGTIWLGSDPGTLETLVEAVDPRLPALRRLMRSLMLAEADPPLANTDGVTHLSLRLDWLVQQGAVEEALALLDISGIEDRRLFSRWTDLGLLLGQGDRVCRAWERRPHLSDDLALRVFCTARSGDWRRAALVLRSAETLGDVSGRKADLLHRFLDPEVHENSPALLPPVRPTPLEFRLFEALGEPLPTAPLPLPFSVLDLNGDNGWRAQIEAAERLARAGSLPANRLLGLYSLRKPAASGGIWDRVSALQSFEKSLTGGNRDSVSHTLEEAWPQMVSARLLVPFAELFTEQLDQIQLHGRAETMAMRAGFLSSRYEQHAATVPQTSDEARFLTAIAQGTLPETTPDLPHAEAARLGFADAALPTILQQKLQQGRLGEVILRAMALFSSGAQGNGQDLTDAIVTLRTIGLEDTARRATLQLIVLDTERALR